MRYIVKKSVNKSKVDSYKLGVQLFAEALSLDCKIIEISYTNYIFFKYINLKIIVEGNQFEINNFVDNI